MNRILARLAAVLFAVSAVFVVAPVAAHADWDCQTYDDGWTYCYWYEPAPPVEYPWWWDCFGLSCNPCDPCWA